MRKFLCDFKPFQFCCILELKQINKNMKNIILTTMIVVLALGVTAQVSKKDKIENKRNGEYAWIKANLDLTETQKNQLDTINKSLRSESNRMKELDKEAKKTKRKVLKEKKDKAYKAVLSTDQIAKLDAHRAEKKVEMVKKRKERIEAIDPNTKADEKVAELRTSIGLTTEQEPSVKQAYVDFLASKKSIALMPKDTEADKEAIKTKRKEAGKALRVSLKTTLTKEQMDKMKEMKKEKRGGRK